MTTRLTPYLHFQGKAREAMEFYASVLGGALTVMTFGDMGGMGGMGVLEESHGLVMHADLVVSEGVTLMGADHPDAVLSNGSVSLSGDDHTSLRAWFDGLAEGGEITMPLEVAPWGDAYGQLKDKFGIDWMFNIAVAPDA